MQNDNFADITSQLHKNSNVTQQWLRLWKLFLCKNCKNVRKDFTITMYGLLLVEGSDKDESIIIKTLRDIVKYN